ncbi:MAG TPA: acyl carrier protein [Candidatus Limnocylindrales bacterium]|nr:acyl carrier protein [Candidatus Limnocylindrales bacterium]
MESTATVLDMEKLRAVVAEVLDVEVDAVTDDAHLVDDLGVDSLMALEVTVVLERTYQVKLDESELPQVITLRKMHELLAQKIQQQSVV